MVHHLQTQNFKIQYTGYFFPSNFGSKDGNIICKMPAFPRLFVNTIHGKKLAKKKNPNLSFLK